MMTISQYLNTRLYYSMLNVRLPVEDLDYTDYGLTIKSLQF